MNLPRIRSGFKLLMRSSVLFFTSFPNWGNMKCRAIQVGICLRTIRSGFLDGDPVKSSTSP